MKSNRDTTLLILSSILLLMADCPDGPQPVVGCGNVFGYYTDTDEDSFTNNALVGVSFSVVESQDINCLGAKYAAASGSYGVGIYSDNSGEPGTLLVGTGKLINVAGWNSASVAATRLTAGTTYWLVAIGNGGGPRCRSTPGVGIKLHAYDFDNNNDLPIAISGWTDFPDYDVKCYATLECP